jgi:basic membrane protein A
MRKFGDRARIASMLIIFTMLLAACGSTTTTGSSTPTASATKVKVALVTDIGGLNDNGFNHLAYTGYVKAEHQYGFKEQVIQTQSQTDYVKNLTNAALAVNPTDSASVTGLVIAVGFLMQTPLDQVAKQYPNVDFAIVDGCAVPDPNTGACETLPNVAPLFFKEQEAGCLVGAIAGQMEVDGPTKVPGLLGKNTIGAVGGLSIPPVNRYIAGFKYCALKADPKVIVKVTYSNDFAATAKCKDAAQTMIAQFHADIIFQVAGGCGIGALDAADANHVFGIGVDADQGYIHSSVITSALKRVDSAVYTIINDTVGGHYTNTPPTFDLAHDGVGYAPVSTAVPADAKALADTYSTQILAGTLVPPATI